MFEKIEQEQKKRALGSFEIKNKEIQYVSQVAKEYLRPAIKLFAKGEQDRENLENKVYEGIRETINEITEYYRVFGVSAYRGDPRKATIPVVKLGWVSIDPEYKTLFPTQRGFEIVDELRKIRGQIPYREAIEKSRENFFGKGSEPIPQQEEILKESLGETALQKPKKGFLATLRHYFSF